jgi:2-oxoglutarate ferredoxin oxidoreductase subunit alpha
MIALCPNSPQESFSLTIKAFNLAEKFRTPVMVMLDECVGHMTERVVIPPAEEIEVQPRRHTTKKPGEYKPFEPESDLVPDMAHAGEGYALHVTGLTHDERGFAALTTQAHARLIGRLFDKIRAGEKDIIVWDEDRTEDADVVVVSYGITSRVAERAIQMARDMNIRVGRFRIITAWPFPEARIRELSGTARAFVVPELNLGQMVKEVERLAAGKARTISVPHAGGSVHRPEDIVAAIVEGANASHS